MTAKMNRTIDIAMATAVLLSSLGESSDGGGGGSDVIDDDVIDDNVIDNDVIDDDVIDDDVIDDDIIGRDGRTLKGPTSLDIVDTESWVPVTDGTGVETGVDCGVRNGVETGVDCGVRGSDIGSVDLGLVARDEVNGLVIARADEDTGWTTSGASDVVMGDDVVVGDGLANDVTICPLSLLATVDTMVVVN